MVNSATVKSHFKFFYLTSYYFNFNSNHFKCLNPNIHFYSNTFKIVNSFCSFQMKIGKIATMTVNKRDQKTFEMIKGPFGAQFHFKMAISKRSFSINYFFHHHLDIHFIWKFKFIYSTLIYLKITISKSVTSSFLKTVISNWPSQNDNPNGP